MDTKNDTLPAPPPWLARPLAQIVVVAALEPGWDGDGALPPAPPAVAEARAIVRALSAVGAGEPTVSPTHNGGVRLEWTGGGLLLTIECSATGRCYVDCGDA